MTVDDGIALLEKSIAELERKAASAAKVSIEDFRKLPKDEQNAFLAQAKGQERPEAKAGRLSVEPLDSIIPSDANRKNFDKEKLAGLTEKIRVAGVIQPLIVRPNPKRWTIQPLGSGEWQLIHNDNDADETRWFKDIVPTKEKAQALADERNKRERWELIAGERRWRAAKAAGLAEVPVIVREVNDRELLELQFAENEDREDLNPIDEARKFEQMLTIYEKEGMTKGAAFKELMRVSKRSEGGIYQRRALLKLPHEAFQAVQSGQMPASHAELIAKLPDADAQAKLTKAILNPEDMWDRGEKVQRSILSFRESERVYRELNAAIEKRDKWAKDTEAFAAAGAKVLPWNHEVFQWGSLKKDYSRPQDVCEIDPEGRTWEKVAKAAGVSVQVARKYEGGPIKVYNRKAVQKGMEKAGMKVEKPKEEPSVRGNRMSEADRKRAEEEKEGRIRAQMEIVGKIVAAAESRELSADVLRIVLEKRDLEISEFSLNRRGLPANDWQAVRQSSPKLLKEADGKTLRGILVEEVCWNYDEWNEEAVTALAAVYGIKVPKPQTSEKAKKK